MKKEYKGENQQRLQIKTINKPRSTLIYMYVCMCVYMHVCMYINCEIPLYFIGFFFSISRWMVVKGGRSELEKQMTLK